MSSFSNYFSLSASVSGNNFNYAISPVSISGPKTQIVLLTTPNLTCSGSQTFSYTVPTTIAGNSFSKWVVTDYVARLISGTPGTAATFGLNISGNQAVSTNRQLPTYGGGVDVALINLNTQNISATYKMANPGDTIIISTGGTFSTSCVFQFDLIGYYF